MKKFSENVSTSQINTDIEYVKKRIEKCQLQIMELSKTFADDDFDDSVVEDKIRDQLDIIEMWRKFISEGYEEIMLRNYSQTPF